MPTYSMLNELKIAGFRAFGTFIASLGPLEVIIGANGSGKTCLLEFLRFLRDGMNGDVPPGIVANAIGQQIFHVPGNEFVLWQCDIKILNFNSILYIGELLGPMGRVRVTSESVYSHPVAHPASEPFLEVKQQQGTARSDFPSIEASKEVALKRPRQLALSTIQNPTYYTLYNLREYIAGWRFYSAYTVDRMSIRRPVPVEQEPVLREDAGNLSSMLFYLMTEHNSIFETLQAHLRTLVPGFKKLSVKARGGPGEVIAFWEETGATTELSLADVSDGILHLLCWLVLCLQPNPPGLLCIDEPDLGVHPRTLPLLAALFQKLSERTQVILTTHSTYFLKQFDLEQIAVMRKENGDAVFVKPSNSAILRANLEDFGWDELEVMHRNDELERFA